MKSSHKELYLICSVIFFCFSIFILAYLNIQHIGYQAIQLLAPMGLIISVVIAYICYRKKEIKKFRLENYIRKRI